MKNIFVVAIDGHAGCGKSSISSKASKNMGWVYFSTGALYRGLGFLAERENIDTNKHELLASLLNKFNEHTSWNEISQSLYYKDEDLGPYLLNESIGTKASDLAKKPIVREKLLPLQRNLIKSFPGRVILVEGRDITTVVCPEAPLKIFMTASIEERAKRRLDQLKENNPKISISLQELMEEISKRDHNDSSRELAPLFETKDSIHFDTGSMSFKECVRKLSELILSHKKEFDIK